MQISQENQKELEDILQELFNTADTKTEYNLWGNKRYPKTPKEKIEIAIAELIIYANEMTPPLIYRLEKVITKIYLERNQS